MLGQRVPEAEEDEEGPLPAEGVDGDAEGEPPEQLEVGEEVEGAGRGRRFQDLGHVDPALHPERGRPRQRVDEEHEEDPRVDADVPVPDGADGGQVRAVDGRDGGVPRRERLEVPVRRAVGLGEAVLGEEVQLRPLVSGRHDDHVALDVHVSARPPLRYALFPLVDEDARLGEVFDVAAHPLGLAGPELVHDVRIDHRCVLEYALVVRCEVLQVSVEEFLQQRLRDE